VAAATLVAGEPRPIPPDALLAGAASIADASAAAYRQPVPTLDAAQGRQFRLGAEHLDARWVNYWFESGQWGAGPTFNADACAACHVRNGRGAPAGSGEGAHGLIVRMSVPGTDARGAPLPHPHYGDQLQTRGVPGVVPAEGSVDLAWEDAGEVRFADGEAVSLRRPVVALRNLAFGGLEATVFTSPRVAPPLVGLGLLDAVTERELLALAQDPPDPAMRGRPNRVWDFATAAPGLGRFGHKANVTSLRQQVAAAFHGDIGVSSDYFPEQNCPAVQMDCREFLPAGRPELGQVRWAAVEFHLRAAAVPARRDTDVAAVRRGEALFAHARCAACHVPELRTGEVAGLPALSNQRIRPYTDLLLHDLGEGLADGRPDFAAGGQEWRTPPLWGIGLTATVNGQATYLHDGRARTLAEAILWHGGQAQPARDAFAAMDKADREALLRFLASL
jgi:CxxC motif-containing protein (DUF1111 family)